MLRKKSALAEAVRLSTVAIIISSCLAPFISNNYKRTNSSAPTGCEGNFHAIALVDRIEIVACRVLREVCAQFAEARAHTCHLCSLPSDDVCDRCSTSISVSERANQSAPVVSRLPMRPWLDYSSG
eukprot:COSAG02_NODE_2882_length_7818_cov_12.332642_4_plen_126_part_00